jgi:hypothetical protein
MIKMRTLAAGIGAALVMALAVPAAQADSSLSGVENSRAKERAGARLSRQDRESIRRYGSNDDGYNSGYGYGYDDGYYGGSGVSVYIGPRRGYGPYGY